MDINSILLFIAGICSGIFLYDYYMKLLTRIFIEKNYKKPLLELEKRGLDIYTFSYRQGDYVVLTFDIKGFIYLDLNKRSVSVYTDKNFQFTNHPSLSKEFNQFFDKLIFKFKKEIYDDIIVVNNTTYSKNIFHADVIAVLDENNIPQEKNIIPELNLDKILDKMNESGFESLTEEEKNFLYKQSDKSEE